MTPPRAAVGPAAQNGKLEVRRLPQHAPHQFDKVFHRPTFVVPARAGQQRHPAGGIHLPFLPNLRGELRAFRQPLKTAMHRDAELRQHREVTVHRVSSRVGARRNDIVIEPGAFAGALTGIVQSDAEIGVGEPGNHAAAGESLQINGQIESLRADAPDAGPEFEPVARRGPAIAFEGKDAGEVRVISEQRNQAGLQPPENLAVRPMELEQAQDGQCVYHVAKRTGLEDENFQAKTATDPAQKCAAVRV